MLLLSRWNGLTSNGSVKAAFLLAITSAKRVGELYALSVADKCIRWSADGSGHTMAQSLLSPQGGLYFPRLSACPVGGFHPAAGSRGGAP